MDLIVHRLVHPKSKHVQELFFNNIRNGFEHHVNVASVGSACKVFVDLLPWVLVQSQELVADKVLGTRNVFCRTRVIREVSGRVIAP